LATLYYVRGRDVYCLKNGGEKEGEALKSLVSLLEGVELAYFHFRKRGLLLLRGAEGWVAAFLSPEESPDEVRLKLLSSLDRIEKEVKEKWQLL